MWWPDQAPLTLREELELGPIDRCTKRGRCPLLVALHIVMVILVTAQFVDYSGGANAHTLGMHDALTDQLLPVDYRRAAESPNDAVETAAYGIFEIDTWLDDWRNAVEGVFNLKSALFEAVDDAIDVRWVVERWADQTSVSIADATTTLARLPRETTRLKNATRWWPDGLFASDVVQRAAYIRSIRTAELRFSLKAWHVERSGLRDYFASLGAYADDRQSLIQHACVHWNASVMYDLRQCAHLRAVLTTSIIRSCEPVDTKLQPISTARLAMAWVIISGSALYFCVGMWMRGTVAALYCRQRQRADAWARTLHGTRARSRRSRERCPWSRARSDEGVHAASSLLGHAVQTAGGRGGGTANADETSAAADSAELEASRAAFLDAMRQYSKGAEAPSYGALASLLGSGVSASAAQTEHVRQRLAAWDQLHTRDHLVMLCGRNPWWRVASAGVNVLNAVVALLLFFHTMRIDARDDNNKLVWTHHYLTVALGVSCGLLWITSTQFLHLSVDSSVYLGMRTLRYAVPDVLRLMFQLSPLFLGYAFFGMVVWGGHCVRFGGLWQSMLTLFAIVNGDIIQDTFLALRRSGAVPEWIAQVYVYSYIMLFMYVGLNTMLLLVEKAYLELPPEVEEDVGDGGQSEDEDDAEGAASSELRPMLATAPALTGGIGNRLRLLFELDSFAPLHL